MRLGWKLKLRYVSLCVKLHKWLTDNMEMAECGALNLSRSWSLKDSHVSW